MNINYLTNTFYKCIIQYSVYLKLFDFLCIYSPCTFPDNPCPGYLTPFLLL